MGTQGKHAELSSQVTHESETQRQFIRLKMPAHAEIDGVRYTAKDLSSGGMAINGFDKLPRKSSRKDIKLILPFFDFALDIDLTAEVVHTDKKDNSAGFRFVEMNGNQLSILNHVLSAFISGEIISGDSLLNVVARENFVKVRKHGGSDEESTAHAIKKYALYGMFILLTFALSFYIATNILNRLTVVQSSQAYVSADIVDVKATTAGLFQSDVIAAMGTVKKGQIIGNITTPTATETGISLRNAMPVLSPCDCFVETAKVNDNTYITEGTPLFTLIPTETDITVSAIIPMEEANRIKIGTKAKIRISASNKEIVGKVQNLTTQQSADMAGQPLQTLVIVKPDKPLTADDINHPAFVEFFL